MKKFIAMLLVASMVLAFAGCAGSNAAPETEAPVVETEAPVVETEAPVVTEAEPTEAEAASFQTTIPEEDVISYADYAAAELDTPVTVETIVQAKQSWWDNMATLYTQTEDGAYFIYNMPCSKEEYDQMTVGTWIRVSGYKGAWAGEVEIMDAQFQILDKEDAFNGSLDITELLGSEDLINYQNQMVSVKGATVEACNEAGDAFMYGWDGSGEPGTDADLYFNVSVNGVTQTFVVEYYLCDAEGNYGEYTDFYKTVQGLQVGDTIDINAFLYWYEGAQPHVTGIMKVD